MAGLLVYNCNRKVEAGDRRVWAGFQSKVTIKLQLYKTFLILCWEMLTITNTFTGQRRPDQIRKKLSSCPVLHPALRSDLTNHRNIRDENNLLFCCRRHFMKIFHLKQIFKFSSIDILC